ncbi:MAG: hypothetical protein NC320_13900, partial [Clostridium sp.]|nr:hypothetical protein [Clostridium sp.]
MFFVDYERFYGIKPSLTGRCSSVTKSDKYAENSAVSDIEDDTNIDKLNTTSAAASQLFGSLKSKAGGLAENAAAFIKSEATADKINAIKNKAKSSAATVSERLKAIELPKVSSISKENPEIKIPEKEKENLDYVTEKYIEMARYQPSWKFKSYCGEKLNLESGSAVKKYRIKVFTFYMRDLLPVISGLYKFDYIKIYEALPMYRNFFIDESGNLDTALLMKASSQIMKKLIERGMLTASGEDFNTIFTNNIIEQPIEEEKAEEVKPVENTVTEPVELTETPIKPPEPVIHKEEFERPVPVNRNIQRKDTVPIFHDNESDLFYNGYYAKQRSHNKVIAVIVIILLIPVIIMCCLKLVDYYQKNHSDDFSAISSKASQTSEITETTAITAAETVKSTVAESKPQTAAVETTETVLIQSVVLEKKISIISIDNISSYPQYENILRTYTSDERCMLCDLNNDAAAELVITNANNSILMIYTIYNNEAVWLVDATGNMSGGVSICENGIIAQGFSGGASQSGVMYKQYTGGDSLDDIEYILYDGNGIHYNVRTNAGEITT